MIKAIYGRCSDTLKTNFTRIWGFSLLGTLLILLATWMGILPIISVPVAAVLYASMEIIYLNKLNGKEPESEELFKGFKNFWHVAGGMCWMYLWIFIWALIPIAGVVMAVIKTYTYRFTPYILMNEPETSPTEALKKSIKMTNGYRGKMFLAEFLIGLGISLVSIILTSLGMLRGIGFVFAFIEFIFILAAFVFVPVFMGLVRACFYQEAVDNPDRMVKTYYQAPAYATYNNNPNNTYTGNTNYQSAAPAAAPTQTVGTAPADAQTQQNNAEPVCPKCGKPHKNDALFCANCGNKLK